jgi:hypothetical protein
MEPATLYAQLGALIQDVPDLMRPNTPAVSLWVGRAYALVKKGGDLADISSFKIASTELMQGSYTASNPAIKILDILYRSLGVAELEAPASGRGSFIGAGNLFDAYAAIGKVLGQADQDLLIVDPYMDDKVLTDFCIQVSAVIPLRLLTDEQSYKAPLCPAVARWKQQYPASRPLDVRLAPARLLHDRLIITDRKMAWVLTQSFNAFAQRSPASIVRTDQETASLKVAAYEAIWATATAL